jgi:hypothetical protein
MHKPFSLSEAMFHLEEVSVRNLRSICLDAPIPLKRITLLVGKNSAGKSTFARIFPLLRQTVQTLRKSPILWFGHLVDFGSFDDASNRNRPNDPIEFEFTLRSSAKQERTQTLQRNQFIDPRRIRIANDVVIKISAFISRNDEGSYLSKSILSIGYHKIEISINSNGSVSSIKYGNQEWKPSKSLECFSVEGHLIPDLVFIRTKTSDGAPPDFELVEQPFFDLVKRNLSPLLHGNTGDPTYLSIANNLPIGSIEILHERLISELNQKGLKHYLSSKLPTTQTHALGNSLCLFRIREILRTIESDLTDYFSGVRYLAPLRATAQRYYRQQELAVDEIDTQGSNLANVLSSIPAWQRTSLEKWMEKHLHFKVETIPSGGHISLCITPTGSNKATNLADMGFGFSQVLPIPIQLWLSAQQSTNRNFRSKVRPTTCIVIEQPELHLHPAFQSRLADLFIATKEIDGLPSSSLIIETHSQALVNRFGELVHRGQLDPKDIQVLLFENSPITGEPTVRTSTYDERGFLKDWPYGFFEPDHE